jgi:exonuclease SbcD
LVLKVLATADNHLDFSAVQFGPKRYERKMDFQNCFISVMDYALKNKPDVVLLGGDLFDSINPRNPPRSFLMRTFRELHDKGIHVIAVSGEHDTPKSFEEGSSPLSVYAESGCIIFCQSYEKPTPVAFNSRDGDKVVVTGLSRSPFAGPGTDPLEQFTPKDNAEIKILLTHYPISGFEGYFPNDPVIQLSSVPRDYQLVVSGHLHRHQEMQSRETFLVYPGSTERASITEAPDGKGFVWLELNKKGLVSKPKFIATPARSAKLLEYPIPSEGDLTTLLKAELERLKDPQLALWLRLTGKTTPQHLATYKRPILQAAGADLFFHVSIEDAWDLEKDKPLDAMPRTTPLQELERYFTREITNAADERKQELRDAFETARDCLKEFGAW